MRLSKESIKYTAWYLKPFFWNQKRKYGQILKPSLVWATIPKIFISLACLYGALDRKKSPLSPELRSIITVRVSQINGCSFCVDINTATLIKRVEIEEKCQQLKHWQQPVQFSPKERAALDYAEHITYSDRHPNDACFSQLQLHFSEQEIIELTALIAFQNMSSKFNSALEIEPQGFCRLDKEKN